MVSFESPYHPFRPSFQDVLDNIAPEPFTLSAFKDFLVQHHAIESLQFLLGFRHYATLYSLSSPEPESATEHDHEHPQRDALSTLWQNLVSHYIIPGSRNEINITTQQRHALLAHQPTPQPSMLEQTVQQIADALRISVFAEFVHSVDMQNRKYRVYTRAASMPAAPTLSSLAPMSTDTDADAAIRAKRGAWFRWPYRRKYSMDQDTGKWKRKARTVVGMLHI